MAESDFSTQEMRVCKKCDATYPLSSFPVRRDGEKAHISWSCRSCTNADQGRRYRKTAEQGQAREYRDRNRQLLLDGKRECKDCSAALPIDQFRCKGASIACRCYTCQAAVMQAKYSSNENGLRDYMQEHGRLRRLTQADKLNAQKRIYVAANRQKVTDRQNEWSKAKLRADPVFAIKKRIRSLMSNAFRSVASAKSASTETILGCTFEEFIRHLELQFAPGMSWDNRDKWHLDHIIPLVTAQTEDEVIRLNHFTNLRPLWAKDNLDKSDQVLYLI